MKNKLNFTQIIFHFIATYFIILSFQSFSWISNINQIEIIEKYGYKVFLANHEKYGITIEDIAYFSLWPNLACLAGISCAFVISVVISKIRNWSFLNSFIVLIISFFLYRIDFLNWDFLHHFLYIGRFITVSYKSKFIINGLFLMTISLSIFFSKWTNKIIQNQYIIKEKT